MQPAFESELQNFMGYIYCTFFSKHQVANLACSMSVNPEKVKMVRLAAKRLQNLCPQVRV